MAEGNLLNARRLHQEALGVRKQIGERALIAESQLRIAHLANEEGQFKESEQLAREATEGFQKTDTTDLIPDAQATLAEALLAQGKPGDAQGLASAALVQSRKLLKPAIRLQVEIAVARIDPAANNYSAGAVSRATKVLKSALADASKFGFRGYQLEARLALGEITMKSNNVVAGRSLLESVRRDAHREGFGLI
jgi:hypothetical protein